jgi:hypothetical protein
VSPLTIVLIDAIVPGDAVELRVAGSRTGGAVEAGAVVDFFFCHHAFAFVLVQSMLDHAKPRGSGIMLQLRLTTKHLRFS